MLPDILDFKKRYYFNGPYGAECQNA